MAKNKNSKKKRDRQAAKSRRTPMPAFRSWAFWAAIVCAAAGGALALYATNLTFDIAREGIVEASGCSLNSWIDCDVAHASSYANFLGAPVAWWGFLFYLWAFFGLLYAVRTSNKEGAASIATATWVLALGSVLFSIYKAFHLVQLGVLCLVCLGMYGANIGLALFIPLGLGLSGATAFPFLTNFFKELGGQDTDLPFSPKPLRLGIFLLVVFGLGFVGIKNYEQGAVPPQPDLNVDVAIASHFRQTPKTVEADPNAAMWGTEGAPIQIVEFADFQCPACREAAFHLRGALFEFRDDVELRFMNYPLDNTVNRLLQRQQHVHAGPAARASICAQEFGDFWEYHDGLFRNQRTLGSGLYIDLAEEQGWDVEAFRACVDGEASLARVRSDVERGNTAQVQATPSVYINGRRVAQWRNTEVIRKIIREELDRLGS